jgi:hypothetical protein
VRQSGADGADGSQRGWIGPVQVLECHHDGRFGGKPLKQRHHRVSDAKTAIGGAERNRIGDNELSDLGPLRIGGFSPQPECLEQRCEWAVPAQLVGGARQHLEALLGGLGRDFGKQPSLSDPGLALHDGGLTGAAAGAVQEPPKCCQLPGATKKRQRHIGHVTPIPPI